MSDTDPTNEGWTPDNTDVSIDVISGGPNHTYWYVASQNMTYYRTFWRNQWLKAEWDSLDVYNPVDSTQCCFNRYTALFLAGDDPDVILEGIGNHEMHSDSSHHSRTVFSITSTTEGCGDVAKYVERAVGTTTTIPNAVSGLRNRGVQWLAYQAGHKYVYGNINNAKYVRRVDGTLHKPVIDSASGTLHNNISAPVSVCIR